MSCEQDISLESAHVPLPDAVASGAEPLLVAGAVAGGEPSGTGHGDGEGLRLNSARPRRRRRPDR